LKHGKMRKETDEVKRISPAEFAELLMKIQSN
jgi:hypothetical protein